MVETKDTIHQYSIQALDSEEEIKMSDFAGKKILIVNVASRCGYTPQYKELQELYELYNDKLVVIGFPCNQFMWQESGSESDIAEFCSKNYNVTFPMTTKIKVKGSSKHPIYKWLTSKSLNGKSDYSVSWNFNKFLVDEKGNLIEHFGSDVKPMSDSILKHID